MMRRLGAGSQCREFLFGHSLCAWPSRASPPGLADCVLCTVGQGKPSPVQLQSDFWFYDALMGTGMCSISQEDRAESLEPGCE